MKHSRHIQKRSYVPQQSAEKYVRGAPRFALRIFAHQHNAAAIITLSTRSTYISHGKSSKWNGRGVSARSPNMVNSLAGDRCSSGRCVSRRMSHSARSVDRCARNIICNAVIFLGLAGGHRPQEIARRRCHSWISAHGSRTSQQLD